MSPEQPDKPRPRDPVPPLPVPPLEGSGPAEGPLPPHHVDCMVCGRPAPGGYGLCAVREGDAVVADLQFTAQHQGAPGLAQGGAVAAVADDLLGHAMRLIGVRAVTRRLEMDYLAPVVMHLAHRASAWVERIDGRKIWARFTLEGPSGRCAAASALFIDVPAAHFLRGVKGSAGRGGDAPARGATDGDGAAEAW